MTTWSYRLEKEIYGHGDYNQADDYIEYTCMGTTHASGQYAGIDTVIKPWPASNTRRNGKHPHRAEYAYQQGFRNLNRHNPVSVYIATLRRK